MSSSTDTPTKKLIFSLFLMNLGGFLALLIFLLGGYLSGNHKWQLQSIFLYGLSLYGPPIALTSASLISTSLGTLEIKRYPPYESWIFWFSLFCVVLFLVPIFLYPLAFDYWGIPFIQYLGQCCFSVFPVFFGWLFSLCCYILSR